MHNLLILMLSCVWLGASSEACPDIYLRYSQHHTFCLPPNASCTILRNGVTNNDKEVILRQHNELRSKIATGQETAYAMPKASNMLQMVWDEELAAVAQKHADQCRFAHDCNGCRRVKNFGVGQNLFTRTSSSQPSGTTWAEAVTSWYNEVQYFQKQQIDGFIDGEGPPATGHFTQEIWAGTWRVGCGYSLFNEGSDFTELYTCNYGPGGNMENSPIYKKGEPCTNCPINSCCGGSCSGGTSYPGLCRISGDNAPQYSRPEGLFFYCSFNNEPDCATQTTGLPGWQISNTLSGSYIGMVLNGGESTTLSFTHPFKVPTAPMCLTTRYRSGPQVDGERPAGTVTEIFQISGSNSRPSAQLRPNPNGQLSFTQFGMTFQWNRETSVSVSFSVPAGKPAQYFELAELSVKQNSC